MSIDVGREPTVGDAPPYRLLAEHASDIISVASPQGVLTYVSPSARPVTGWDPAELVGRSVFELVHPADLKRIQTSLADSLAAAHTFTAIYRLRRKTGEYMWAESTSRSLHLDSSNRDFVVITRDITERQQLVEALRESENKLRIALEAAQLGSWSIDPRTRAIEGSPRSRALFGLKATEPATFDRLVDRVHPDDRDMVRRAATAALDPAGSGEYDVDHRVVWPDGTVRWVRARARGFFEESGGARRAVSFTGTVQDITDEIRSAEDTKFIMDLGAELPRISDPQEILDAALDRLVDYLGASHALISEIDRERSKLIILSDRVRGAPRLEREYELWEWTTPERLVAAEPGAPVVINDLKESWHAASNRVADYEAMALRSYITIPQRRGGRFTAGLTVGDARPRQWSVADVELVRLTADRTWTAFENARLLRAEQLARAERESLLTAARENEAAFRAAFEQAAVGMAQIDLDGRAQQVNQRLAALLGYTTEELVGTSVSDVTHPADRASERGALEQMLRGEVPRYETSLRFLRRDGSTMWAELFVTLLRDERGTPLYFLCAIYDITSRRSAESRVAAGAERMTRLQRVTAELSRAVTPRQVSETLVTHGRAALGASAGVVALLDASGTRLVCDQWFGYPSDTISNFADFPLDDSLPLTDAVRLANPVWIGSREMLAERYPQLVKATLRSRSRAWAALPLMLEHRVLGAVGVSFEESREFHEDERAFAVALSQQCAQALERARLYEAERASRAEAEDARLRAEEANRAKSGFLAVMSHELRTPLNAIGGYVQLLQMGIRGPITDEQREDLDRIERSQRTLLGLISDVLNFAKLESGHIDYHIALVPVHEVLSGLEALVRPQLVERNLVYRYAAADPTLAARADRDRVLQILLNLLTNAVKFTSVGGSVMVWTETTRTHVAIHVRDTGRGIPPQKLEMIFQPFVQVDTRLTRESGGIGLGLSISRDLARAMGGDLVVESIEGEGSTFTLILPRG
jgi:PAS domain S-box-containing protein